MHLTINEIVYLIKTWNSWYLVEHDSNLNSHFSENGMKVAISPFDVKNIPGEVIGDLKSYTENIDMETPGEFRIDFLFLASDHQPGEICEALKPVLNLAVDSECTLLNFMDFIETDLPREQDEEDEFDAKTRELLKEYREKAKQQAENGNSPEEPGEEESEELVSVEGLDEESETEDEETEDEETEDEETDGDVKKLHNELTIKGIIRREYVEVTEVLHNGKPLENLPLFLEASRLFETIERNFHDEYEENKENTFQCSSPEEARMVEVYLATSTDLPPKVVDDSIIQTLASPEDLAAVVTYVRYKQEFQLFQNPYLNRLRLKRKEQVRMMREMMTRSCSCLMYAVLLLVLFVLGWLIFRAR
jgi:hypothetical protein